MTLILDRSKNARVKTFGDNIVYISNDHETIQIDMTDFCAMAMYVLTNSDLAKNDPRLKLLKWAKRLKRVKGFNPKGRRLA